jgi:transcriptional regulator with XRE-family HTH domain
MSATIRDKIKYFCQQKGMTEEQLADEINKTFERPSGEELTHVLNKGAAIGRREMLDKVCQYLFENYHGEKLSLRMIEDMRKAMEEQQ